MPHIPFSPPDITQAEIDEVVDTLRSGWLTTGPKTKRFEKELSAFCGTNKTVCLNSATACSEMTLRLLGIGPGDEVITTAYTYTASASVVCHVGAKLVLVDTMPGSFQMDPAALERAVTPRTKVIIPVDLGGVPCDYPGIFKIVEAHRADFRPANELQEAFGRIIVMADSAHGLGARRGRCRTGTLADFTIFSFHAVKNLTTGEGGAVTWRDIPGVSSDELYRRYMLLSLHGQSKDALAKEKAGGWEYDILAPDYKCNLTDIAASIGLAQLSRYDAMLARRRALIERYDRRLADAPVEPMIHFGEDFSSSGHLYLMCLTGRDEQFRNQLIRAMAARGVVCNVHYKPLPLLTAYRQLGFDIKDFPNAYAQFAREITLPLYSTLTDSQADFVADCLLESLAGAAGEPLLC